MRLHAAQREKSRNNKKEKEGGNTKGFSWQFYLAIIQIKKECVDFTIWLGETALKLCIVW